MRLERLRNDIAVRWSDPRTKSPLLESTGGGSKADREQGAPETGGDLCPGHPLVICGKVDKAEGHSVLGYMGHSDWHDMSEYLVHLTEPDGITGVFQARKVEARTTTGVVKNKPELGDSQKSVCLSEIPLGHLDRLADRHGAHGIGFTKRFAESQDGQMVTYLRKDTPAAVRFQALVTAAMRGGIDPANPLWKITQFVDNPGEYGDTRYEFDWEREWRVPHDLTFTKNDVAFLLAPEEDHQWMRQVAWPLLTRASSPYAGIVLDPRWDIDRIQSELKGVLPSS